MTLNFAELAQKVRSGTRLDVTDIADIITAGPGATFALVELAAEFRRAQFGSILNVANLVQDASPSPITDNGLELSVGAGESPEDLADSITELAAADTERVTFNFLVPSAEVTAPGAASLTPMYCLRLLAAMRLAAPEKSLRLAAGRDVHLRSLQALALQVVDSILMTNHLIAEPRLVFEDLKLIRDGNFSIEGAENRDITAEYVELLEKDGITDAPGYAKLILTEDNFSEATGGCGGGCACGSGGCGSSAESAVAEPAPYVGAELPQVSSCGCGGGGCGSR